MIYCLKGELLKKTTEQAVILCGGVGYQVQLPATVAAALPGAGAQVTLYTYMNITENDVSLFGFSTEEQQACFKMLIGVSGVGPRVGMAILSVLSPEKVALAVSAGDHKAFTAASGVGPKLAQRIALELKDKVGTGLAAGLGFGADAAVAAPPAGAASQALAALVSLGYSQGEAAAAVARLDDSLPVEELVRQALRSMAARR